MKTGNVQDKPLQPPASPRLDALREQRQLLGTRREVLQQELQLTCGTLRELHADLNTRGSEPYEMALRHRREIEAELTELTEQKAVLRHQTAAELEVLGQPIRQALYAEYVATLAAYVEALQAALQAQQRVDAVVAKGQQLLGGSTGCPACMPMPMYDTILSRSYSG